MSDHSHQDSDQGSRQDRARGSAGFTEPAAHPPSGHSEATGPAPAGPFADRLAARYGRGAGRPGREPVPGRRTGRISLTLGVVALVTSIAVVGGAVGIAAIVTGMRARAHARRGGTGGGMGTAGLALGALSLLVAVTVAGGTWAFYERHGDDLHRYQECRREARSPQALDECSRRFSEALRTEPTSNG
ncbi:hypothetical protein [Frankia sp. EAN1pec]|uniref:hypothetical protein n=1 Tax=Parafrankia sp. (strain EAN1pec) TaxID=298653 RepID=UPI0018DC1682